MGTLPLSQVSALLVVAIKVQTFETFAYLPIPGVDSVV